MKKIIFLILLLISSTVTAQISTDRPDQTEASVVLPKNILQIESGFVFQDEEVFNNLFRYGISEKVEFRLNTNYMLLDSTDVKNIPSPRFGDIEIGMKIQIFKSAESSTTVAFLSHLSLPTASKYYTNDGYGTLNRFLISHDFSDTFSVGYNLGYNKIYDKKGAFVYTLAFAKSLNKWGVYAEIFGEKPKENLQSNFDLGVTYLINKDFQLDVSFGEGFNNDLSYFALGASWNYNLLKSK
jgi:hypothetical protein